MNFKSKHFEYENFFPQLSLWIGLVLLFFTIGSTLRLKQAICFLQENFFIFQLLSIISIILGIISIKKLKTKKGIVGIVGGLVTITFLSLIDINLSCSNLYNIYSIFKNIFVM